VNPRRVAAALRQIARALVGAADALEPATPRKSGLVVEHAEPGTPEAEAYVAPGSQMASADELCARIYLARALRRYSPSRPPSA